MVAVRAEWTSILRDFAGSGGGDSRHIKIAQDASNNNNYDDDNDDDGLAVFIGNVIMRSILYSERVSGSRHLARGFLNALGDVLRGHRSLMEGERGEEDVVTKQGKIYILPHPPPSPLTALDVIVMVALYSHPEYRCSVESVIDSMSNAQILSFLTLLPPLIRSWLPSNTMINRVGGGERTHSLLYKPLAYPLMSALFYIMISSSLKVTRDGEGSGSSLMGGLMPFRSPPTTDVGELYRLLFSIVEIVFGRRSSTTREVCQLPASDGIRLLHTQYAHGYVVLTTSATISTAEEGVYRQQYYTVKTTTAHPIGIGPCCLLYIIANIEWSCIGSITN